MTFSINMHVMNDMRRWINLTEYKLIKTNYNIWQNPSSSEIEDIIENSYTMQNYGEEENFDNFGDDGSRDGDSDEEDSVGFIHGLEYPLRGVALGDNIYIVDSYYADHPTLLNDLENLGIQDDYKFDFTVERENKYDDWSGEFIDTIWYIKVSQKHVPVAKEMFTIKRLKLTVTNY